MAVRFQYTEENPNIKSAATDLGEEPTRTSFCFGSETTGFGLKCLTLFFLVIVTS
jgi:hypothetical protein